MKRGKKKKKERHLEKILREGKEKKKKERKETTSFLTDNVAIAQCAELQPEAKPSPNGSDKRQCQEDNYNRDFFTYVAA